MPGGAMRLPDAVVGKTAKSGVFHLVMPGWVSKRYCALFTGDCFSVDF